MYSISEPQSSCINWGWYCFLLHKAQKRHGELIDAKHVAHPFSIDGLPKGLLCPSPPPRGQQCLPLSTASLGKAIRESQKSRETHLLGSLKICFGASHLFLWGHFVESLAELFSSDHCFYPIQDFSLHQCAVSHISSLTHPRTSWLFKAEFSPIEKAPAKAPECLEHPAASQNMQSLPWLQGCWCLFPSAFIFEFPLPLRVDTSISMQYLTSSPTAHGTPHTHMHTPKIKSSFPDNELWFSDELLHYCSPSPALTTIQKSLTSHVTLENLLSFSETVPISIRQR